jgi:hypothetical protein
LIASNFDGHRFVQSKVESFVKLGFVIGSKLETTRRITVDFDKSKPEHFRRDIPSGSSVFVKGYCDDQVVCAFEAVFGKNTKSADVALKTTNLRVPQREESSGSGGPGGLLASASLLKKYPFLRPIGEKASEKLEMVEVKKWTSDLMSSDPKVASENVKSCILFGIDLIKKCVEAPDEADLLIVKNEGKFQVWTLKDFKAGSLVLIPETTECKARFYTSGRSVICKNTADPLSDDKRPFVLDGRVRGVPNSKSSFSVFWLIERIDQVKDVNMSLIYSEISIKTHIDIAGRTYMHELGSAEMPSVPVLVNQKKLAKHTQLFAKIDKDLSTLMEKQAAKALQEKEKPMKTAEDEPSAKKVKKE